MNNEIKEIKISKSNHSIVIIKNGVTVKEQFAIDDEILDYITNLQEENERLNNNWEELEKWLKEDMPKNIKDPFIVVSAISVLDKLKELKEGK